jgi:hypothetical protein
VITSRVGCDCRINDYHGEDGWAYFRDNQTLDAINLMAGSPSLIIYSIKRRYPSPRSPNQEKPYQSLHLILWALSTAPLPPHPRPRCRSHSLVSNARVGAAQRAVGSVTIVHIDTPHTAAPVMLTSVFVTNSTTAVVWLVVVFLWI